MVEHLPSLHEFLPSTPTIINSLQVCQMYTIVPKSVKKNLSFPQEVTNSSLTKNRLDNMTSLKHWLITTCLNEYVWVKWRDNLWFFSSGPSPFKIYVDCGTNTVSCTAIFTNGIKKTGCRLGCRSVVEALPCLVWTAAFCRYYRFLFLNALVLKSAD